MDIQMKMEVVVEIGRLVDWWQVFHLRSQYDRQQQEHTGRANQPTAELGFGQAADLRAAFDTWKTLFKLKGKQTIFRFCRVAT